MGYPEVRSIRSFLRKPNPGAPCSLSVPINFGAAISSCAHPLPVSLDGFQPRYLENQVPSLGLESYMNAESDWDGKERIAKRNNISITLSLDGQCRSAHNITIGQSPWLLSLG